MGDISYVQTGGKTIIGTDGGDLLSGTKYDDKIYGKGGADFLDGFGGNDLISGGGGADNIYGGGGINTVTYSDAPSAITVDLSSTADAQGFRGDADGDVIGGFVNVIGSKYADIIYGDGNKNELRGGAGNDKLYGRDGSDVILPGTGVDYVSGGNGFDLVSYKGVVAAVKVDLSDTTGLSNLGEAYKDVFASVEGVGGTDFNDILLGTDGANRFLGYEGKDLIRGFGGNDQIHGDGGHDNLTGDAGADQFFADGPDASSSDVINDFSHADNDTIELDGSDFGGLAGGHDWVAAGGALVQNTSPTSTTAQPTILYDTDSGRVYVDLDGTGPGAKVQLFEFTSIPAKVYADDFHVF